MLPADLVAEAEALLQLCRRSGLTIATAESCTGGLVAALLTEVPGSSDVFERGFVTYSNEAKRDLLGVPGPLIADHGAVSEQVARAMAEGALNFSPATLSVAITGVAGPGGGTVMKPVGTVHIAAAIKGGVTWHRPCRLDGDRAAIRRQSAEAALGLLKSLAGERLP
jgi:nicotinamide-nucleotide amidase